MAVQRKWGDYHALGIWEIIRGVKVHRERCLPLFYLLSHPKFVRIPDSLGDKCYIKDKTVFIWPRHFSLSLFVLCQNHFEFFIKIIIGYLSFFNEKLNGLLPAIVNPIWKAGRVARSLLRPESKIKFEKKLLTHLPNFKHPGRACWGLFFRCILGSCFSKP